MNVKLYATAIISVVICAVMLTAVMPIFETSEHAGAQTFTNTSTYTVAMADGDSFESSLTAGEYPTVNGDIFYGSSPAAFVMSENLVIQSFPYASNTVRIWMLNDGTETTVNSVSAFTLSAVNGTASLSYTVSSTTTSATVDLGAWSYYYDEDGRYVLIESSSDVTHVNSLDDICGSGVSGSTFWAFKGTAATANGAAATSNMTSTAVSGTDAYTVSIGSSSVTLSSGSSTYAPVDYIVPVTVYGDVPGYDAFNAIVSIVPLLILIGLVLATVKVMLDRRD